MAEFTSDVTIEDIAVRDTNVSSAVDEPLRAMILDMLAERARSVAEIHAALGERGYDRTPNTVRHHVNELRDAGLVEVARLEEEGGATTKYYRANTIVLSYALPDDADAAVAAMADEITPEVAALVAELREEYGEEIDRIVGEMAPCEHCRTQKYETYLLSTVLRRAFVAGTVRDGPAADG
ncbi:winged helix-turn-helix domain-containing protein [Natrinema thermotolerans]|uniref:Winged helix-turn-helix domain-containing protein n=1 Tax=Natrinema thermotolerans TaxID=121872 RepID=A0AAF0PBF7_9EURY|nr:winged helix-turn-helix domain-containing protein [Natrinema thermotolerans]QCC60387.1 ArsR family transcriptional regulator [Natrinema thermotolerans]QCC61294.1 ArsR family transcriptional regulator [Natrinema thermotolerans]WMT07414.1 winged helix-turn-helix domain-containing protein [Natrinema thermotolerans]WMT08046.1 winged helix-turn-helix domain-containing protein [Natrinema thermotolerans]